MKKLVILSIIAMFATLAICIDASAAKKSSSKKKMDPEIVQKMSNDIDRLTKKVYGHALLSPEDNQTLIEVKINLDNQMLATPDLTLAPLYYKAGVIFKLREMNTEATECFQTILENFYDTAMAPKARTELRALGVEVKDPVVKTEEEE